MTTETWPQISGDVSACFLLGRHPDTDPPSSQTEIALARMPNTPPAPHAPYQLKMLLWGASQLVLHNYGVAPVSSEWPDVARLDEIRVSAVRRAAEPTVTVLAYMSVNMAVDHPRPVILNDFSRQFIQARVDHELKAADRDMREWAHLAEDRRAAYSAKLKPQIEIDAHSCLPYMYEATRRHVQIDPALVDLLGLSYYFRGVPLATFRDRIMNSGLESPQPLHALRNFIERMTQPRSDNGVAYRFAVAPGATIVYCRKIIKEWNARNLNKLYEEIARQPYYKIKEEKDVGLLDYGSGMLVTRSKSGKLAIAAEITVPTNSRKPTGKQPPPITPAIMEDRNILNWGQRTSL